MSTLKQHSIDIIINTYTTNITSDTCKQIFQTYEHRYSDICQSRKNIFSTVEENCTDLSGFEGFFCCCYCRCSGRKERVSELRMWVESIPRLPNSSYARAIWSFPTYSNKMYPERLKTGSCCLRHVLNVGDDLGGRVCIGVSHDGSIYQPREDLQLRLGPGVSDVCGGGKRNEWITRDGYISGCTPVGEYP